MPVKWVVAYDRRTGKKLDHLVPRSYLKRYPHLSETPAAKSRRSPKPATPAPAATDTTPEIGRAHV